MKAKINLEKFICSYVKYNNIQDALKDQGLKCWRGEIVEIPQESEDERIKKEILDLVSISGNWNQFEEIKDWLEKQCEQETDEWKEGNIIRHGGILALVIRGRRVMKSNGEIFTVQYPDEWVKAAQKEIEHFLNEFEKQGEQPQGKTALESDKEEKVDNANKVEPKFYEGDWVVSKTSNLVYHVDSILLPQSKCYYLSHDGGVVIVSFTDEQNYHLWTIADAKDGDVLTTQGSVFIFKHLDKTGRSLCKSYCEVIDNSGLGLGFEFSINGVCPATKEQRDLLFAKMKEAGYEWDAEKKELKKIEPSLSNSPEIGKNDTLLDLLHKMPSYITVDGIDYHFVMKKTSIYIAYYACYRGNGEEGRGNAIFGITAHSPIDLLTEMLEILKEKGLLE